MTNTKKPSMSYADTLDAEEIALQYEHERCFYEALGAKDDFMVISIPMPDGTKLTDEEKSSIVQTAIHLNTDLVLQLETPSGDMVVTVLDPNTMELKENSKVGVLPGSDFEYHS